MAPENVTVVQAIHDAQERGDDAALLALLHPEMMAYEPEGVPYAGFYRDYDGYLERRGRIAETWQGLRAEVERYLDGGDGWVVAMLQSVGRARATGAVFMMPIAEFWRVRDGRAVELRTYYWDTALLHEILRH